MSAEMKVNRIRRTQYLISKKLQLKYVGVILLFMFLTTILCSYVIYYTSVSSFGRSLESLFLQELFFSIIKITNVRILWSFLVMIPIVAVIGIFLSHRIAGPIYSLERFVINMSYGDFSKYVVLRKNDELKTLADKLNNLVRNMKTGLSEQKRRLAKISTELDGMKCMPELTPQDRDSLLRGIHRIDHDIKSLIKEYDRYKL